MSYTPQPVQLARFEPKTFRVTMSPVTNVGGQTFSLNVRSAGVVVTGFPLTNFSIESASGGIFKVTVPSATTGALDPKGIYDYDIWRTNAGSEAMVAFGQLEIVPQQWQT